MIEVAERLLLPGRVAPGDAPLGPEARDLVLRLALARAQLDDRGGLRALRERFDAALAGSPEHAAFVVATGGAPVAGDPHAVLAGAARQADSVRALLAGGRGFGG
ncbi:MAG TPA: hypothetical protein VFG47_16300 [Geminicoccaceae bacterium]|nr:hypothetical protein [Geminicoccaceae bacterium]